MRPNLNPQDVVVWFREQAAEFMAMAERVEKAFNIGPGVSATVSPGRGLDSEGDLSPVMDHYVREARRALKQKSMRRNELASRIGLHQNQALLDEILTEEKGFEHSGQGWFRLREEGAA